MTTHPEPQLEQLLQELEGLTRAELSELVTARIPKEDALSFVAVATGLSIEALRFVSARALLRQRATDVWIDGGTASSPVGEGT